MSVCSRRRLSLASAALGLTVLGCRGDQGPFEARDRDPAAQGRQLTFNLNDDRYPAWSANGDSLYYTAEGFGELSASPGVLLRLAREGGIAQPILPNVQSPGVAEARWLVAPTPEEQGERLAFVEIFPLWGPHPCSPEVNTLSCSPERIAEEVEQPPLRQIAVRIRRFDEMGPLEEDAALNVAVPGVTTSGFTSNVKLYPFQQLFAQERAFGLRPSWAPDGERLALSDGLRVLIWTVGAATAEAVPNTEDGVWPAWSPDGEWLAFTRLERADSTGVACDYVGVLDVRCRQVRTEYMAGRHLLTLVRPDGSDLRELGEGDEPAWAPNGSVLFFRRDNRIWRIAPDGSNEEAVPSTEDGREPAVSPDGRFLAFAKLSDRGEYNIWVISVVP